MRHTDLVNAIEALVDATCADSVKDALAAVCAAKSEGFSDAWNDLSERINAIPNLGV